MTVTGGLESLAARCQRATVHGLAVQRAVVAMVRVRGKAEVHVAVPIGALIEVQLFTTRPLEDDRH